MTKPIMIYTSRGESIYTQQQLEDLETYCQPGVHRCDITSVIHFYDEEVEQEECARNERWVRRFFVLVLSLLRVIALIVERT